MSGCLWRWILREWGGPVWLDGGVLLNIGPRTPGVFAPQVSVAKAFLATLATSEHILP